MKRQIVAKEVAADQGLLLDIAANCLIMLSQPQNTKSLSHEEVFKCKTCNREFTSFQALGGHRASHKREKLDDDDDDDDRKKLKPSHVKSNNKHRMHECCICGQRFSSGQALGGHMRKHRNVAINEGSLASMNQVVVSKVAPVLMRSSSTRVVCLDLNLTPLENDLKLLFGAKAPKLNISF